MSKGWLGSAWSCRLNWRRKNIFNHCHDHLNHHNWPLPASITWELAPSDCKDKVERPPTNWAEQFLSLWLGFVNKNQPYLFLGKILFLKRCSSYLFQPGGAWGRGWREIIWLISMGLDVCFVTGASQDHLVGSPSADNPHRPESHQWTLSQISCPQIRDSQSFSD